jgi:hypothetical protein
MRTIVVLNQTEDRGGSSFFFVFFPPMLTVLKETEKIRSLVSAMLFDFEKFQIKVVPSLIELRLNNWHSQL